MASPEVIVHELAHMWFGDSVSLKNWQDVWLKEGFATYAAWLWDTKNDPTAMKRLARDQRASFFDNPYYSVAAPAADRLYSAESYTGGALVLQALRQEVGDEVFFKILQTYAERYRYGVAGTGDFIAVANEVSGRNLKPFFDQWLFSKTMPQLP
jgi:aminopeptidase N